METGNNPLISPATKSSSWPIARGSIDDFVTCESSISTIDSYNDDLDPPVPVLKPPLVLSRPSPHSGPCEITIGFAQQHEIKQVYVRSTARVYEIYCATNTKDGNEYLCTVRCGVASRDEHLLTETDTDAVGSSSTSFSEEGHSLPKSRSSTNEDGWVDVKLPNSSGHDQGDGLLSKESHDFMEQRNQDFFEASAEISDADPVLSVTLRLLSIQSGDHIYIDEVYVFADPVLSDDVDSSNNMLANSSGNALMSMLVPTLLQLSKSRTNQSQQQNDSVAGEGRKHQDAENKPPIDITSTSTAGRTQNTMLNASTHMPVPEVPVQTPYPLSNLSTTSREISCSRIERSLDELLSRVAKIEQFCSRFEENLVKPIKGMEARLERVEQQLESIVKTSQFPRTSSTRIFAPEFSYNESESNSVCTDGNDYLETRKSDSINKYGKDECCPEELSMPPSSANVVPSPDMPSPTGVSHLLPSLVVTAPDFSNVDDEEENDAAEAVNDMPNESPKKRLSIDDALAFALAGFLSSTPTIPLKCADNVVETADCPSVEGSGSTSLQSDDPVPPSVYLDGGNETAGSFCNRLAVTEQESLAGDNSCKEAIDAADKQDHILEEESDRTLTDSSVVNVINFDEGEMEDSDLTTEVRFREAEEGLNQTFVSDYFGSSAPSNNLVPAEKIDPFGKEVAKEDSEVLQNILKLPSPVSVDFNIPILDVKFLSLQNSSAKSPLKALLPDEPEFQSESPCVKEQNECLFSEQNGLIVVENEDSATYENSNNQFFSDNYESGYSASNTEEELQDLHKCSSQDMCGSLI